MAASSRRFPSPHEKVTFLCQEAGLRGGSLRKLDDVCQKTKIQKTQFSNLFGSPNREGHVSISTEHVAAVTIAFKDEGYAIEVEWWDLDFSTFRDKCREANAQPAALAPPKALPAPTPSREEPADLPSLADTIRHFDEPPALAWHVTHSRDYTELATASLHRPSPYGNSPDSFDRLDASFRCAIVEYPFNNRTIAVGLREVILSFDLKSCTFAANTLLGDARRPLDGVTAGANSITVKAPKGDMLASSPLLGHYIAELEPIGTAAPSVSLTVLAPERGITFAYLDAEGQPEPPRRMDDNKEIILNLIYDPTATTREDPRGRLLLATSKVEKKSE